MLKKESLFAQFLGFTFIPFIILGLLIKQRTKSTGQAVFFAAASLCSLMFVGFLAYGTLFLPLIISDGATVLAQENAKLQSQIAGLKQENCSLETKIKQAENKNALLVSKKKEPVKIEKKKENKKKAVKEPVKSREYTFSSGNYTAGKDFKAGTYDIIALDGMGNVISDNMYTGGINAIMGTDDSTGMAEKKYKNIELPSGVKLEIKRVKIKLVSK